MRRMIIAGNWKMNKNIGEALELANGLKRQLYDFKGVDIVICPVFTALSEVAEAVTDSNIQLGAQDVYWNDQGAFTGEIAPTMLKDAGAKFVIIGHSERRQFFGETNETVNLKLKAALRAGLKPIVCVGEMLADREGGLTFKVLDDHIRGGLKDLSADDLQELIIAYEPVWAIGTGKTATASQAQEAQKYIRDLLVKLYNKELATQVRIQYGGSVKPENTKQLMEQPDIDGALVGGASLKVDSFSQIVKVASEVKKC
ncbi:triose-phosphate isomerase [Candidatus Omnitrophota bacterium]